MAFSFNQTPKLKVVDCKNINLFRGGQLFAELQRLSWELKRTDDNFNRECFDSLSSIAKREREEKVEDENEEANKRLLQDILTNHFYKFVHPKSKREEEEREDDNVGKFLQDYIPEEFVEHLPPDLAAMISGYHSNCAILTADGAQCGLGYSSVIDGKNSPFTYHYSSTFGQNRGLNPVTTEESYCQQECRGDLCESWLNNLIGDEDKLPFRVDILFKR